MKKLLAISSHCIIICLVLSSCNSNTSIVKRHYRSGYYVEHTKKATTNTPVASKITKTTPPKRVYVTSIPFPEKQNTITLIPDQDIPTIPNTTFSVQKNTQHKNTNTFTENLAKSPGISEAPTLQKEITLSEGSAGGDGGGGGAALSLLWIVIIIILILWLIGILAGGLGLGGLINLLLVIALVLLILWLLHIV